MNLHYFEKCNWISDTDVFTKCQMLLVPLQQKMIIGTFLSHAENLIISRYADNNGRINT